MTANRFWRLDQHPQGSDFANALSLQEETLSPLTEGEVRVKVGWLSMDAGTRISGGIAVLAAIGINGNSSHRWRRVDSDSRSKQAMGEG